MGNSQASRVNKSRAKTSRLEPFPGVIKELMLLHNLSWKIQKDMDALTLMHQRGLLCCKPHDELLNAVAVYPGYQDPGSISTISRLSTQPVCTVNFYVLWKMFLPQQIFNKAGHKFSRATRLSVFRQAYYLYVLVSGVCFLSCKALLASPRRLICSSCG